MNNLYIICAIKIFINFSIFSFLLQTRLAWIILPRSEQILIGGNSFNELLFLTWKNYISFNTIQFNLKKTFPTEFVLTFMRKFCLFSWMSTIFGRFQCFICIFSKKYCANLESCKSCNAQLKDWYLIIIELIWSYWFDRTANYYMSIIIVSRRKSLNESKSFKKTVTLIIFAS